MRVAVFHNYMDNIGGAEKVGLTLARELGADLYSTNIDAEKIDRMGFDSGKLSLRSIGRVPVNAPFRQQAALTRFRRLDLAGEYDCCIIDGDWALSGAVNNKPNLWYVHSPIREIWDLYKYTRTQNIPMFARPFFDFWVKGNRHLNRGYVKHAGKILCNSENTRERIRKYLGLDAQVVYPPVDTSKFHFKDNGGFWLSVNRLITHKRVDMQLEAFRRLPDERLIIVGSYEKSRHFRRYAEYINNTRPKNVELLSWVDSEELVELYASCKGFITTSKDEDFGMTAVEAMASGKPVIAPDEGGYRESVIDGVTGRLVTDMDPAKLAGAIKEIGDDPRSFKEACMNQAKNFSSDIFISRIRELS